MDEEDLLLEDEIIESNKTLDDIAKEDDFDPEEEELYDEDTSFFPSIWDKR